MTATATGKRVSSACTTVAAAELLHREPCAVVSHRAGRWAVLAAATLWGTTGTVATFAPRGTSSVSVGAAAMGIGGLLLFITARRQALGVIFGRVGRRPLAYGAVCIVAYPLAFYTSMADAGVALGVTLSIGSAPVIAALIERFVNRQRLSRGWIAAVLVAITGAALLGFSPDGPHSASGGHALLGILLALIAGGSYAGYSIATATLVRRGVPSRAAVGALFGLAATVLIPLLLITGATLFTTTRGIAVAGYLGFVPMGVGYLLFGYGLQTATASTATALSLLEPATAAILADIVAHQHIADTGWIGIALVAASVLLQTRAQPTPAGAP